MLAYISMTSNCHKQNFVSWKICTQINITVQNTNFIPKTIIQFHIQIWIYGMHVFTAA